MIRTSLLAIVALIGASAHAADFFDDFSTTTNTVGDANPWLYGTSTTAGGAITPFADYTDVGSDGISRWSDLATESLLVPSAFKNTQVAGGAHGLPIGQAALHGGKNGEIAVAAYTFPTSGLYRVTGAFGAGDFGLVDEFISLNGLVLAPYTRLNDADGFAFDFNVVGVAGGSIAFSVGIGNDTYFNDTTPLSASIQAVPEPSAFAALGLGALGFLRRKRKA